MLTDREQLTEIRKEIILGKMAGKSEAEKERATKDLHRMSFTDHEDFMSYVDERHGPEITGPTQREATEEEIDAILGVTRSYKPKAGEASQSELDELFKNMGI